MKSLIRYVLIVFLILLTLSGFVAIFYSPLVPSKNEVSLTKLVSQINKSEVKQITIRSEKLEILLGNDQKEESKKEAGVSLGEVLTGLGVDEEKFKQVDVEVKDEGGIGFYIVNFLPIILPFLLVIFLFWFMFRQAQRGAMQAFSFGKTKARLAGGDDGRKKVTFDDVAGLTEAKEEISEVVEFLSDPKKFQKLGARIPRGILLIGAPGTGKTLLAKAVANEASVPFYSISGSEFVEMFVGVGASCSYDTKVLIRTGDSVKLMPIGKFIDQFYGDTRSDIPIPVRGIWTLGVDFARGNKFFKSSSWKKVGAVYRHKVDHIYEISFAGGKIKVTSDHSIFVRNKNHIIHKKASELKVGDILISLPYTVRNKFIPGYGTKHLIKSHDFPRELITKELIVWPYEPKWTRIPRTIISGLMAQGASLGGSLSLQVSSTKQQWATLLPYKVKVTPALLKLLGYYTAEGDYHNRTLRFSFGSHEGKLHNEVIKLMKETFGLEAWLYHSSNNATVVQLSSVPVGEFFEKHCGQGAHNKRVPEFLWDLPKEYFVSYLFGLVFGDGYINKRGIIEFSSVSSQLISELRWLSNMHGIPCSVTKYNQSGGRRIKNGNPLPCSTVFRITIGKLVNPFIEKKNGKFRTSLKRPIVKKIVRQPYPEYVYDLCGCENEAFFGGEKPILLHNSRVRDTFDTAKKTAPSIIFIDELDAIGRHRGAGLGGGHDEREQTLNQILVEMDGFDTNDTVIVMAASVTGNTPVLVNKNGTTELKPIKDIIDPYYAENEEGIEKESPDIKVLGFDKKPVSPSLNGRTYFQNSSFKKVRSVFRHRVKEIYEIKYLGGTIRTTGNHSVFVRSRFGVEAREVSKLKPGDYLIDIPYIANRSNRERREVRAHSFPSQFRVELPTYEAVFAPWQEFKKIYEFALANRGAMSQSAIAANFGFSQAVISHWQLGLNVPRQLSHEYFKHELPEKVVVTPELTRLLGYYTAEGYARKEVDFCFNTKEIKKINDLKNLFQKIFNIQPDKEIVRGNATNIIFYSKPLAEFFGKYCGKGAHNKHVPSFLFKAPREYFIEFFRGYFNGDGYRDKRGRIEITSVSKQLILELNWLSRMHGFKSFIHSFTAKEGRIINNGKPLEAVMAWRIGFGKTQNPLEKISRKASSIKRPVIKSIRKLPYNDYVYDFCGCDSEAFFGGESPLLLHNTNRPDILDPALLRPGRFDRRIILDEPSMKDREEILKIHALDKPLAKDTNLKLVAERTPGFSGADLANLLNEAAILAARKDQKEITQENLFQSIEKVMLGPERRSHAFTKKEKEIAAYHEAGHALVAVSVPHMDPVHKVSIVSRGRAGGYTLKLPIEDKHLRSKSEFESELAVLLGGYASEKMTFNELTTGAANDLKIASELARKMVTQFGMSDKLGPVTFGEKEELVFLGREIATEKNYSNEIAFQIDSEIKALISRALKKAKEVLTKKMVTLTKIATELITKETLEQKEFYALLKA